MRIKQIVAHEIWKIRQELDIDGNEDHDWWLANIFLQKRTAIFDNEDIYVWFIELDENIIPRKKLDNDSELCYNEE